MSKLLSFLTVLVLMVAATTALATDITISTNTVWSGTVTIDGKVTLNNNANLTIQPGTTINFVGSTANLHITSGGTLSALGTAAQPIYLTGSQTGLIDGAPNKGVLFDHCVISGMGSGTANWFNVNPQSQGFSLTNSTVTNCSRLYTAGNSGATISNCAITNVGQWSLMNSGGDTLTGCKVNGAGKMRINSTTREEVSNNVLVNCAIWSDGSASANNILVHDNYINNTAPNAEHTGTDYGLQGIVGQVYNNFVHGASWTVGFVGGHVYNNVVEGLTASEVAGHGDTTHEQLNDFANNSVVEHNIVLNNSMGSFMTANVGLALNCVMRNNTFDQRCAVGSTASGVIYLNHNGGAAANMLVSNNLFMRGGRIFDETSLANAISYVDYNGWAGRDTTDSFSGSSSKFVNIVISGKTEGDDGFGMHDVTLPTLQAGFNPASVVQNANYTNPYTDAQMLAGTYTISQLLSNYWQAFAPTQGSALIDAGDPNFLTDPNMVGGRIDIGAVEASLPVVTYLPGDADCDHKVTFADYIILERNFGATNATWAMGDFNSDGKVTFADYILLETNFGKSAPEPMTLSLLAAGAVALLRRKR